MKKIATCAVFLVGLLVGAAIPAARAAQAQVIGGGTVQNVAVGFNPTALSFNPDSTSTVAVIVYMNGAPRVRAVGISADGLTFTLDGQPLVPWAALTALGNAQVGAKVNAVFQAPGAVAPLTAP